MQIRLGRMRMEVCSFGYDRLFNQVYIQVCIRLEFLASDNDHVRKTFSHLTDVYRYAYYYTTQIKPIFNIFKIKFILNIKSYLKDTKFYK